jgi:hypothetical protein
MEPVVPNQSMELVSRECPMCGKSPMLRVDWSGGVSVRDGRVIQIYTNHDDVPDWVCLNCEPRWLEVSRLSQQLETLDIAKENACGSQNWSAAVAARDAADLLRPALNALVGKLVLQRTT